MSADGGEEMVQVTRADWEAMQGRLARLEQATGLTGGASVPASPDGACAGGRTDRRGLLKHGALLAAGAVAGSAVAVVSQAAPAAAANGDSVELGSSGNSATQATGIEVGATGVAYGFGVTDNGLGAVPFGSEGAIFGHAKGQAWTNGVSGYSSGSATGVYGLSVSGTAVVASALGADAYAVLAEAQGTDGIAVVASGTQLGSYGVEAHGQRAALFLPAPDSQPPMQRTDAHHAWEIDGDSTGTMWLSVVDGTPGTWVRLGAPGTAGALSVLPASVRVYDSRSGQAPTSVGPKTPLVGGTARAVDMTVNSSGVPAGANAVLINLTAVPRSGSGFLAVFKAGIAFPGTSTLNWSATGNPIANAAVVAVGAGKINLLANASTDVIVDVVGYYL